MNAISNTSALYDADYVADKLRISKEIILKLHRAFDPNLSFEEHAEIFPLDLGAIWNLAAFQAVKRHTADIGNMPEFLQLSDAKQKELLTHEWGSIYDQLAVILKHGSGSRCKVNPITSSDFIFQQSQIAANQAQRTTGIHVDGGDIHSAFKNSWRPPSTLILHARDIEPVTAYMKGIEQFPEHLVDHDATEDLRESARIFIENAREALGEDHPNFKNYDREANLANIIAFDDEAFTNLAKSQGKFVTFAPGRIIALTDRVLHGGQSADYARRQTFAFGQGVFRPQP